MADSPTSLRHADPEKRDDSTLAQEAQSHIGKNPALQLVAELLQKLRVGGFSWWTPEQTRSLWPASQRMGWLSQRPDIRQRITTGLTGLAPRAARNKTPEFQGALLDSVIEDGDVTVKQFDEAFTVEELAVYGPTHDFWAKFRERLPWDQDTPAHQELIAWLFEAFLASQSAVGGHSRKPILTSLALRTAIPGKIWHTRIPLEVRVAIDDLRFQREKVKPSEAFHAIHDLSVATPSIIASNIALRELTRVVDVAEKSMGYGGAAPAKSSSPGVAAAPLAPTPPAPPANNNRAKSDTPKPVEGASASPSGNTRAAADEDFAFDDDEESEKTGEHNPRKREPVADAKRR